MGDESNLAVSAWQWRVSHKYPSGDSCCSAQKMTENLSHREVVFNEIQEMDNENG